MRYKTNTTSTTTSPMKVSLKNHKTENTTNKTYDIIVFCHLRWDFVYQRPQHIISRMAKDKRVLFVEEPIGYDPSEENMSNVIPVNENLTIIQPKVKSIDDIKNVLTEYIVDRKIPLVWFYSASFVPLLTSMKYDKVVYDCMDELTMFKGAKPELREQERYLLSEADLVFTGGKSLYESKAKQHESVHCFPSSVDRSHFEKALNGIEISADLPIGKPIVGYYGVIDERIDLDLIRETAAMTPEINFVMVGPLAKIHESDLPRATNIHYIGMAPYTKLPNYLKGFDIAMMPFALNDATKYISPTKTLEYMAAHKPIISTAIYDVVRTYGSCVDIVANAETFNRAIIKALNNKAAADKSHVSKYESILQDTSWDATVEKMVELINNVTV